MPETTVATSKRTTKGGLDLNTFENVKLFKEVPIVPPVTSVEEALARVGNDTSKLMKLLTDGLQSEAVEAARSDNSDWKMIDADDKDTEQVFEGTLANTEDVNPVVLMFAKLNHGFDDIDSKAPNSADLKRAAKQAAIADIKEMPKVLDGLRRKAGQAPKSE